MPWENMAGNPAVGSGRGGLGSAPTSVGVADGFDFTAGQSLTVSYVSGLVNGWLSSSPTLTAAGQADLLGESAGFPGFYMNPAVNQISYMELVGAFTNSAGRLIGNPFAVGNGPTTLDIPTGASFLKLGFNDGLFSDNIGSLTVLVEQYTPPAEAEVSPNPEPASVLLLGTGGGLVVIGRKFRRRKTAAAN